MQLTQKEWALQPEGTKAFKVKTFDGNNAKCIGITYILKTGNDEESEDLQDAKEVSDGYFTETWNVVRQKPIQTALIEQVFL